jgi:hypothetical protein
MSACLFTCRACAISGGDGGGRQMIVNADGIAAGFAGSVELGPSLVADPPLEPHVASQSSTKPPPRVPETTRRLIRAAMRRAVAVGRGRDVGQASVSAAEDVFFALALYIAGCNDLDEGVLGDVRKASPVVELRSHLVPRTLGGASSERSLLQTQSPRSSAAFCRAELSSWSALSRLAALPLPRLLARARFSNTAPSAAAASSPVVTVCGPQELGAGLGASVTEAAAIALENGPVVLRRADVLAADALAWTLERGAESPVPVAARLLEESAPSHEGECSAVTVRR